MDGWATLNNLKHQCESLKPGTEYVIKITQNKLDKQFKKAISGAGCNVKLEKKNWKTVVVIVKKPKESDDLDVDDLLWSIEASANKDTAEKIKEANDAEKQMKEKEKQMIKYERVALMNPSRELRDMVKAYNKELDKKHIDVDKFYKVVKEAHQAIVLPSSYIDSDTYKIFISSWWVKMIIWDLKKKLKEPYYKRYQKKINEIIKLLEDIDKKAKPKDYWLA